MYHILQVGSAALAILMTKHKYKYEPQVGELARTSQLDTHSLFKFSHFVSQLITKIIMLT